MYKKPIIRVRQQLKHTLVPFLSYSMNLCHCRILFRLTDFQQGRTVASLNLSQNDSPIRSCCSTISRFMVFIFDCH